LKKLVTIGGSVTSIFIILVLSTLPLPVKADGGPVVGPALWQSLKEGQQIAVVTLRDTKTADVSLFISLLDSTGESHEVAFFVPLGFEAANFGVEEQYLRDFDELKTKSPDTLLYQDARRKQGTIDALFGATLLTNGIWLLPLWLPVMLSGCAAPPPQATFETDSSQVSIYGIDADTDLDDLIGTTGLDPSVRDTLSRLQGQKIAVIHLQTKAKSTGGSTASGGMTGETGVHLHWSSSLVQGESGAKYTYPLGTGTAWFHPIEMTRVYVVALPGIDFRVEYPKLGAKRSGYDPTFLQITQRIMHDTDTPAYAVDEATGDFGRVWRAIYTQSNAAEDITIYARPQSNLSKISAGLHSAGNPGVTFLLGFIVALALWIIGWRYLMPRLLGGTYRGDAGKLWTSALLYTVINIALMLPGIILYLFWATTGNAIAMATLFLLFGGVAVVIFALRHIRRLSDKESVALRAFILVTLASNGAYLVLALIYSKLTGII
jgi:hypothetical protein